MNALERLRADILSRYASIHAFCRHHENLKRSTVYSVLSGTYAGNADEQLLRIRNDLDVPQKQRIQLTSRQIAELLLSVRCGHCRPTSRRRCQRCRERAGYEADAVIAYLGENEGGICHDP